MTPEAIDRLLHPLRVRLNGLIKKGEVTRVSDDGDLPVVQAQTDDPEPADSVEVYQPYGYASRVKKGALGLFLAIGGSRAHTIAALLCHPELRLRNLEEGEVAMYDDLGNVIHLQRTKVLVKAVTTLEVEAPTVTITSATVNVVGTLQINGVTVVAP